MKIRCKVFTSMWEDSNEGWVWIPPEKAFNSRDYISLKELKNNKEVVVTCRKIDTNFLSRYNHPRRKRIEDVNSAIVINSWYRDKLGELQTGAEYEFEIKKIGKLNPKKLMMLIQHPDNAIKLATWLAFLSILLGGVSVLLTIIK